MSPSWAEGWTTAIRRTFKEGRCPRTSTGHAIAVAANVVMKSRRLINHVPRGEENAGSISALRSALPTEDDAPQLACSGEVRIGSSFPVFRAASPRPQYPHLRT